MDPALTTRLLALPALRRQAEEDAREALSVRDWYGDGDPEDTLWRDLRAPHRVIAHFARLLADLTRWQSQAWAVDVISKATGWVRTDVMRALFESGHMLSGLYRAVGLPELERWEPTPQPVDAIAAILLHLSGVHR